MSISWSLMVKKQTEWKPKMYLAPQFKTLRSFQKYFSKAFSRSRWKVSPWNRPQVVPTERIRKRPRRSFLFNNFSPFLLWIKFCEKHNNRSSTCENRIRRSLRGKNDPLRFSLKQIKTVIPQCSAVLLAVLCFHLHFTIWACDAKKIIPKPDCIQT